MNVYSTYMPRKTLCPAAPSNKPCLDSLIPRRFVLPLPYDNRLTLGLICLRLLVAFFGMTLLFPSVVNLSDAVFNK
ncbi:hypothetical protein K439DRAFT_1138950 [Ramaria rubella]|nr:hypothetical protein K439DRAFT_1138950 [Ramaria rubella]